MANGASHALIGIRTLRRSVALIRPGLFLLLALTQPAIVFAGNHKVESPYLLAAREAKVPLDLLVAIAGAESGYHPWALNIHGHQVFCQSREEAEMVLAGTPTDDVDIGLMQINWRFWGPRSGMTSKGELLDPRKNLAVGAAILKDGLSRGGSLWHRISNYHSGGPQERQRYNKLVYDAYLKYLNRGTRHKAVR